MKKIKQKIFDLKRLKNHKYSYNLNKDPLPEKEIHGILEILKKNDYQYSLEAKSSGNYYFDKNRKLINFLIEISKDFMYINPLHFNDSLGSLQIQSELVSYMTNLFNGNKEVTGTCTAGGTESIFIGAFALRDRARERGIKNPKILCGTSAHAAIDKACHYLGIKLVKFPHNEETAEIDYDSLLNAVDKDTIAVYLSGISFPFGNVDDVQRVNDFLLGKDSKTGKINPSIKSKFAHVDIFVDSCLGGFITSISAHLKDGRFKPIDFRLEKVTIITCDPHKYAMSPKGSSVILFRDHDLKSYSSFSTPYWTGGVYGTPGMLGSRGSAGVVGAWASLKLLGMSGLVENYRVITYTIDYLTRELRSIPELQLIGNPKGCSVSFNFTKEFRKKFNIVVLNDILKVVNKWKL